MRSWHCKSEMRGILDCGYFKWSDLTELKCHVAIELSLKNEDGKYVFSCEGTVVSEDGDLIAGGQCLDTIFRHKEMDQYREIYDLWKEWHRNDLTPGSPRQTAAVNEWRKEREKKGVARYDGCDYDEACEMLKNKGLLVDKEYLHCGKPYTYGTAWLYRDIPEEVVDTIKNWIDKLEKI